MDTRPEHSSRDRLVFFVDADNTLWGTDAVYAGAQNKLLKRVECATGVTCQAEERLMFVRHIDQTLAQRHHLGFRYPPSLLVHALARALTGASLEGAAIHAWRNPSTGPLDDETVATIARQFVQGVRTPPALLPGAIEGLRRLRDAGATVFVVTEGDKRRVEETTDLLGISSLVDRIIAGPKRKELFARVLKLAGRPRQAFMIGDQIARDMAPAKASGLTTVYVPGAFKPRWEASEPRGTIDMEAQRFDVAVNQALSRTTHSALPRPT